MSGSTTTSPRQHHNSLTRCTLGTAGRIQARAPILLFLMLVRPLVPLRATQAEGRSSSRVSEEVVKIADKASGDKACAVGDPGPVERGCGTGSLGT